jgi:hypothetical protein
VRGDERDRSSTLPSVERVSERQAPGSKPHPRAARPREVRSLYRHHFKDARKERQLLSLGSFFVTFAAVRAITHSIRAGRGPFKNITPGGRHIHHMTFGIITLITVGYLWLLEIGIRGERRGSRLTALAYGSGAALTLDEFALWLNLQDDYWTRQGRESIDAVALFGSLLGTGAVGKEFLRDLARLVRGGGRGGDRRDGPPSAA